MMRREFIAFVGGAAAWSLAAGAQQPAIPVIGLMGSGSAATQSELTGAFIQRLRELGWTDGRNVSIEYRWGEGRIERFAEIATEFVRLRVNLILTHNTPPTLAAKQATSVIPIVFSTSRSFNSSSTKSFMGPGSDTLVRTCSGRTTQP